MGCSFERSFIWRNFLCHLRLAGIGYDEGGSMEASLSLGPSDGSYFSYVT